MRVQSLGWQDPLEEGKATHSSVLVWRIPWAEEPGGLQSMGSHRVRQTERLSTCERCDDCPQYQEHTSQHRLGFLD